VPVRLISFASKIKRYHHQGHEGHEGKAKQSANQYFGFPD
jgi:hypothetical protein